MAKLELSSSERSDMRARAHSLDPVVTLSGKGLADSVVAEVSRSLDAHELIKVKTQGLDREQRQAALAELCDTLGAAPVQLIGNILIIWRPRPEKVPVPKAAPEPERRSTAKSAGAFVAAARRKALASQAAAARRKVARPRGRKKVV